jgi:hypothetical protein
MEWGERYLAGRGGGKGDRNGSAGVGRMGQGMGETAGNVMITYYLIIFMGKKKFDRIPFANNRWSWLCMSWMWA